jgi:hypothetical protein
MTGTLLSPNCKIKLYGKAESFLVEYYHQQVVYYLLLVVLTTIAEISSLIKQMSYTITPSVC